MRYFILKDGIGRIYSQKLFKSRGEAARAAENTGFEPVEVSVTYVPGKVARVTDNIGVTDGLPYVKTSDGLIVLRNPLTWVRPNGILIVEEVA